LIGKDQGMGEGNAESRDGYAILFLILPIMLIIYIAQSRGQDILMFFSAHNASHNCLWFIVGAPGTHNFLFSEK
jgi:hypothetical protein